MSHSATYGDFYVIRNGDFSGPIQIHKRDVSGEAHLIAELPFWLLAHIVAEKVRQDSISKLEQASPEDLLFPDTPRY